MRNAWFGAVLLAVACVAADAPKAGWREDVSKATAPDAAAAGKVVGREFTPNEIKYDANMHVLRFRLGKKDELSDAEIVIDLSKLVKGEKAGSVPEGKTFEQAINAPLTTKPQPSYTIYYRKEPGKGIPDVIPESRAAMKLEFGERKGDVLPGKIYLCLPDKDKSYVAGTFDAAVHYIATKKDLKAKPKPKK